MVAVRSDLQPRELTLDEARDAVERARDGLLDSLLAARPEEIRRLARTALDAERAVFRRRGMIGIEPAYSTASADAAIAGYAALRAARLDAMAAGCDARRWLLLGNTWGVAALAAAGALVTKAGIGLMSAPIAIIVMAAAAGPLSTAVAGLVRCSQAGVRTGAVRSEWATAVDQSGFTTYGELQATGVAHEAWRQRCREAEAAALVADDARAAWHRVAGPHRHPREAPLLLAKMAVLRAAQIEVLRMLLEQRLDGEQPTEVVHPTDTAPGHEDSRDVDEPRRPSLGRRLVFWTR